MKGIPVAVGIFFLIMLFIYGMGAFILWQWNPRWWEEGARFAVAFFGTVFALAGVVSYLGYKNYL